MLVCAYWSEEKESSKVERATNMVGYTERDVTIMYSNGFHFKYTSQSCIWVTVKVVLHSFIVANLKTPINRKMSLMNGKMKHLYNKNTHIKHKKYVKQMYTYTSIAKWKITV